MSMAKTMSACAITWLSFTACGGQQTQCEVPGASVPSFPEVPNPLGPPIRQASWTQSDCARFCPSTPTTPPPTPPLTPLMPSEPAPGSYSAAMPVVDEPTLDPDRPMPAGTVSTSVVLQLGREAAGMVDARADIFSSGETVPDRARGGVLPSSVQLAPEGGVVTFQNVRGSLGCRFHENYGPDGGPCAGGQTSLRPAAALSGIVDKQRTLFLTGVFLGRGPSPHATTLDFSDGALGMAFEVLTPQLGQVFFIGDGLTGTASGTRQRFVIPAGATTLYLGFADGFGFRGAPGSYVDNTGSLGLRVLQQR